MGSPYNIADLRSGDAVDVWLTYPHPIDWLSEIKLPIEVEAVLVEDRPSRLLGPAVSWGTTFDRGVCPICGVTLLECVLAQASRPHLGPGIHGYSRVTYPDLAQRPA